MKRLSRKGRVSGSELGLDIERSPELTEEQEKEMARLLSPAPIG